MYIRALLVPGICLALAQVCICGTLQPWGIGFDADPVSVVSDYFSAFNDCDVDAMNALRSLSFKLFLPGGCVVDGKVAAKEVDESRCASPSKRGGKTDLQILPDMYSLDGPMLTLNYTVTSGLYKDFSVSESFLVIRDEISVQVSTFEASRLKTADDYEDFPEPSNESMLEK